MKKSCNTCENSIDGAPDCGLETCKDCCRLSNWTPKQITDQFNDDYSSEDKL